MLPTHGETKYIWNSTKFVITSKKRTLDRPFIAEPIRRLMKMDGKFDEYSTKDRETLIKVGVHISTILRANHNSTPAVPRNMINYTRNKLRINQVFCRTYTGRLLRFNIVLKTSPASAMELIFNEFHKKLHCRLGPWQYINDQMRDQHSSPSWNTSSYTTKRVYTNQEASRI